ncbi:MAG: RHS repeat-associated core domain-containing protein, partial [Pirellulaceae bacterium]
YTHDALDRLTRVDQIGQTGGNSVAEKRVDLAYNAIDEFTSIARYKDTDGGTTHEVATAGYGYDSLGRLMSLAYTKGGTNLFTPYSWTYDSLSSAGLGFGEAVADSRVSATAAAAVLEALGRITQTVGQDGTSSYGYDTKSQLTSATHSYQSNESYTYDNNGNRTMTGYQTGANNRLTNDGTYSYQYDNEGNRTRRTKTATGEVTEYEWDYHNQLVKVTDKNSQGTVTQAVEYVYDIFDRRIGRKLDTTTPFDMANAVIERYVLDDIHNGLSSADGGNVVLDFIDPDGSGAQAMAISKRYLYGEAVDQIFAQEDLSKTLGDVARNLWPLVDHLGTVRDLAKQDGTIAEHFKYDSYGRVTSGDTSKTRYLFTSREFDTATKLQYNRARWYDAEVGRWISEDPLGFAAGDANVGRYAGNLPDTLTDPSGRFPWLVLPLVPIIWHMMDSNAHAPGNAREITIIPTLDAQKQHENALELVEIATLPIGVNGWHLGSEAMGQVLRPVVAPWVLPEMQIIGGSIAAGTVHRLSTDACYTIMGPDGTGYPSYVTDPVENLQRYGIDISSWFVGAQVGRAVLGLLPVSEPTPSGPAPGGRRAATPVGRSGGPLGSVEGNLPTTIGGRPYSGHAIDRMQGRGIPPSAVDNTIRNGMSDLGKYLGTTIHYDPVNDLSVVVDTPSGRVITVSQGKL